MHISGETAAAPSSPASTQSCCRTGGVETPYACGYIYSRDRTTSGHGVALYGRLQG